MKEEIIDLGIAKIKIKPQEERKIVLIAKCPFCDLKVRGTSHSQVDWNLSLHLRQKHSEDEEAQILLKQLEEQRRATEKQNK